jgi:hypothetical protein
MTVSGYTSAPSTSLPLPGLLAPRKEEKARTSLWHGMRMAGLPKLSEVMFSEADDASLVLRAARTKTDDYLRLFVIASSLASAAETPISRGSGREQVSSFGRSLTFFDGWRREALGMHREDPARAVVSFLKTVALEPRSLETRVIDWEADLNLTALNLTPLRPPPQPPRTTRAFAAFTELHSWLRLSVEETAALVGVGRTTPINSWLREGHEPRPETARRLYQLHALVSTVAQRLGSEGAYRWFASGSPSMLERLEAGDQSAVIAAAERDFFHDVPRTSPRPGSDVAPREDAAPVPPGGRKYPIRLHGQR